MTGVTGAVPAALLGQRYRPCHGGHVESWFLKANEPGGRRAIWLRWTIFARPRSADPSASPVPPLAEAWAIAFDRDEGHVAVKTTVPYATARFGRGNVDAEVDGCALSLGETHGAIDTGGRRVAWGFGVGPARAAPILHIARPSLYDASFPPSKAVTPLADARLGAGGVVHVRAGERAPERAWSVEGWPAMIGHNWGRGHPHLYAWSHVSSWDAITLNGAPLDLAREELVFEGVSTRIRVGPVLSPMVSAVFVRFRGESFDLNGRELLGDNRGLISLRRWEVTAGGATRRPRGRPGRRIGVRAELAAETDDLVGLHYPNPRGSMTYCLNTKLARARLELALPTSRGETRGETLVATSRAGALELGTRDASHGVRMYV